MQVGDLVMWLGKDEWHGMIGVITKIRNNVKVMYYDVLWGDGTQAKKLYEDEIMAVEDEERRQSETQD